MARTLHIYPKAGIEGWTIVAGTVHQHEGDGTSVDF